MIDFFERSLLRIFLVYIWAVFGWFQICLFNEIATGLSIVIDNKINGLVDVCGFIISYRYHESEFETWVPSARRFQCRSDFLRM